MKVEPTKRDQRGGAFPAALAAGLVICLIVAGAVVLMSRRSSAPKKAAQKVTFPFGATEQAYAPNIHFSKIKLAKAQNFLGEEFTYVQFSVTNAGTQDVHGLSIQLEFYDPFKQVILKDKEQLIGPNDSPLHPKEERGLQITLGGLPAEWNHADPIFRVTGLALQ